jgi:hypothetical protein
MSYFSPLTFCDTGFYSRIKGRAAELRKGMSVIESTALRGLIDATDHPYLIGLQIHRLIACHLNFK